MHINVAAEYCARSLSPGVPFTVVLDATTVTVPVPNLARSILCPTAKSSEPSTVTLRLEADVTVINFPASAVSNE